MDDGATIITYRCRESNLKPYVCPLLRLHRRLQRRLKVKATTRLQVTSRPAAWTRSSRREPMRMWRSSSKTGPEALDVRTSALLLSALPNTTSCVCLSAGYLHHRQAPPCWNSPVFQMQHRPKATLPLVVPVPLLRQLGTHLTMTTFQTSLLRK